MSPVKDKWVSPQTERELVRISKASKKDKPKDGTKGQGKKTGSTPSNVKGTAADRKKSAEAVRKRRVAIAARIKREKENKK